MSRASSQNIWPSITGRRGGGVAETLGQQHTKRAFQNDELAVRITTPIVGHDLNRETTPQATRRPNKIVDRAKIFRSPNEPIEHQT
jgi:hypothetical protein